MGRYFELINLTAKVYFSREKNGWKGSPPHVREVLQIATLLGWNLENDQICTFGEDDTDGFFLYQGDWVPFPAEEENEDDFPELVPDDSVYQAYQTRMREKRRETRIIRQALRDQDPIYQHSKKFDWSAGGRHVRLKELMWRSGKIVEAPLPEPTPEAKVNLQVCRGETSDRRWVQEESTDTPEHLAYQTIVREKRRGESSPRECRNLLLSAQMI